MFLSSILAASVLATVGAVDVTVKSTGGNASSVYQYGIMFEDISHSGDGGVYAELVQNRAFQGSSVFPSTLDFWSGLDDTTIELKNLSTPLSSALPTSMRVTKGSSEEVGFANDGYWGFPVVNGWTYTGSFFMKGDFDGNITVSITSNATGEDFVTSTVTASSTKKDWTQFNYTFISAVDAPDSNNTLQFTMSASDLKDDNLEFNLLSLFPPTYNDQPNGLRIDLMEAMAGMKPSLFRMPGGNNLEGEYYPYNWNWTHTIGPLKDRPGYPGPWGYTNTDGLGLIDYLLWAQDLSMTPILAVWSGLFLDGTIIAEDDLAPYVQSALDELEFLMGDASTVWGAKRIALGYPDAFDIPFVEVGNEDSLNGGADSYAAYRFPMFYDAIHAAYPNITIIASYYDVGPIHPPHDCPGDFHEYLLPQQMSAQFTYFDNYTADHPLLLGEYAVVEYDVPFYPEVTYTTGELRAFFPFWYGSLAEAIYLLGMERNGDKILAAMYAPGFMNLNDWQWIPDNIAFDANPADTIRSTSWHVIRLLSSTRMTETLPMHGATFEPAYYVAGCSADTGSHVFKAVVYNSSADVDFHVKFEGVAPGATGQLTWLTAPMNSSNTIGNDVVTQYNQSVTSGSEGKFKFTLPDWSVAVFEVAATDASYASTCKAAKNFLPAA